MFAGVGLSLGSAFLCIGFILEEFGGGERVPFLVAEVPSVFQAGADSSAATAHRQPLFTLMLAQGLEDWHWPSLDHCCRDRAIFAWRGLSDMLACGAWEWSGVGGLRV